MSSTNRTTKIKSLFELLKKQKREAPKIKIQNVLETLIYAACLENATFEQADGAFSVLEYHFIDWNEVRVSTAKELGDVFQHLPDPIAAGERIRKALQSVFETMYMFDLQEWKSKPLSQAMELLRKLPNCTPFMIDYTIQTAFGGHAIALDESALRVFRLLGLAQTNKENTKEDVPALERTISKSDAAEFTALLHQFAVPYFLHENPNDLRTALKGIDPQSAKRDWTAPVLQILKPVKPEKPIVPATPALPDVTTMDEEEFHEDDAVAVKELDFIPNPITGEEVPAHDTPKEDVKPAASGKSSKKKESKKSESKKKESKKAAPPVESTDVKPADVKPVDVKPVDEKPKRKRKAAKETPEEPPPSKVQEKEQTDKPPVRKLRQKKPK